MKMQRPIRAAGPVLVTLLVASLLAPCALAQDEGFTRTERFGDLVSVFSGDVQIPADLRQRGTVVCVGGNVTVEGQVSGDVIVILGDLKVTGEVGGSVVAVLSDQEYGDAEMQELISVLGSVEMERTRVRREFLNVLGGLRRDAASSKPSFSIGDFGGVWLPGVGAMLLAWRLLRLFCVFVIILLVCALVPERVRAVGQEAPVRYLSAMLVGLLCYLALLIVLPLLALTVIGLPLGWVAFYALKWIGIAGIFFAVGRRVGRSFGREMSLLGAVLLVFTLFVAITLAPSPLGLPGLLVSGAIGTVFFFAVECPALGLVVLTRVGGRSGPPASPAVEAGTAPAVEPWPESPPPDLPDDVLPPLPPGEPDRPRE